MKNFKSLYTEILENYTPEDSVLWDVRNYSNVNENTADNIQTVGDVIGVFDPTPITDTANAIWSIGRGIFDPARRKEHFTNAGIRLVGGWLPYVGDVGKAAIHGGKAIKGAKGAAVATKPHPAQWVKDKVMKQKIAKPGMVSRAKTALRSPAGKRILTGVAQLGLLSALSGGGDSGAEDKSKGGTNLASPTLAGYYSTEKLGTPGKFGPKLGPAKSATK